MMSLSNSSCEFDVRVSTCKRNTTLNSHTIQQSPTSESCLAGGATLAKVSLNTLPSKVLPARTKSGYRFGLTTRWFLPSIVLRPYENKY